MSQDTEIVCSDCENTFTFTAQEQEFFAEKNFTPPKRCRPCRQVRKEQGGRGNDRGGGGDRGGDRGGSGERRGSGGPKKLYDAVCADCKKATQVPFQPSGDRPVYCRDCFRR